MTRIEITQDFRRANTLLASLYPAYLASGYTVSDDAWLDICNIVVRDLIVEPANARVEPEIPLNWHAGQYGTWRYDQHFDAALFCSPTRDVPVLLAPVNLEQSAVQTRHFFEMADSSHLEVFRFVEFRNPFSNEDEQSAFDGIMGYTDYRGRWHDVFIAASHCKSVWLQAVT